MGTLNLAPPPGVYLDDQMVQLSAGAGVTFFSIGSGATAPAISEYIAYDQLVPPNPFIAVTQDGKGNVVYDGGFPKLYTRNAPAVGTSFASLPAAYKFFHNAINFCADPKKVAENNKKILILGDKDASPYYVKGGTDTDFLQGFNVLLNSTGFTGTFKTSTDYPGNLLDPTLSELSQYALVIVMSSQNGLTSGRFTAAGESNMVSYRNLGGGLIFITDHGFDSASLAGAYPTPAGAASNTFFTTANQIMRHFGAFFTGLYDRSPVNVGFLRSTYGDHPLYNGMSNAEDIFAGGSESKVVVEQYPRYNSGNPAPSIPVTQDGVNYVRTISKMSNGDIVPETYVYIIGNGDLPVELIDAGGNPIRTTLTITANTYEPRVTTNEIPDTTQFGYIKVGATTIGEFHRLGNDQEIRWYGKPGQDVELGYPVRILNGEKIRMEMVTPFAYTNEIAVTVNATPSQKASLGKVAAAYLPHLAPHMSMAAAWKWFKAFFSTKKKVFQLAQEVRSFGRTFEPARSRNFSVAIATSTMPLATVRQNANKNVGVIFDVVSGKIYRYGFSGWEEFVGMQAKDIFGICTTLNSIYEAKSYFIDASGSVSLIS